MCRLSHFYNYPTLVAQSDVHSVGDLDLIPTGSGNILSWRLIMKDFLVILSHPLIYEGQLSASGKRICTSTD